MRLEGSLHGHSNAKRLRKQITPPEIALWLALRANEEGLRFRKQHALTSWTSTAPQPDSRSKSTAKLTTTATAPNETQPATPG
jgi:hypothetical protein